MSLGLVINQNVVGDILSSKWQVDKLKVLGESLANSSAKAQKRIADHRFNYQCFSCVCCPVIFFQNCILLQVKEYTLELVFSSKIVLIYCVLLTTSSVFFPYGLKSPTYMPWLSYPLHSFYYLNLDQLRGLGDLSSSLNFVSFIDVFTKNYDFYMDEHFMIFFLDKCRHQKEEALNFRVVKEKEVSEIEEVVHAPV